MTPTVRKFAGIAAGLAATVAVAATPARAAEYTVVVMQALTGVGAFAGVEAAAGAKFAAEEINATNYLGAGNTLNVIYEDDGSDRQQATTLTARYAADPKVLAIFGPTIAPTAVPAGQLGNDKHIVTQPLSNSLDVAATGPWTFITSQPAVVTMPGVAKYAVEKAHVKDCAGIYLSDNQAYVELNDIITDLLKKAGVKIVQDIGVRSTETDFAAIATRIVNSNPGCILMFTNAPVAGNLAAQMRMAGLDPSVKMIGHSGLATPDLVKFGGTAVEGLVFNADWAPGGAFPMAQEFAKAFKAKNNRDPDNFSAMGDAALYVIAAAIKANLPNPTREAIQKTLYEGKPVPVVMGTGVGYSRKIEEVGKYGKISLPDYGVLMLQVKNGKFELVQ